MRRFLTLALVFFSIWAMPVFTCFARDVSTPSVHFPPDQYFVARVASVSSSTTEGLAKAIVVFEDGDRAGQSQEIEFGSHLINLGIAPNSRVVVVRTQAFEEVTFYIADVYRSPSLLFFIGLFLFLAVFWGRWRGFGAVIGLLLSVLLLTVVIVPLLLRGYDPVSTTVIAGGVFSIFSLYLAHGISRRTSAAVVSTVISLAFSGILSFFAISITRLTGAGSEATFFLDQLPGFTGSLDLRGLFLAGIILGTLGVLDDVTTAQSAVVDELIRANPSLSTRELYSRSLSVGREHISSVVNTLFLAYAGASLPLFLLFSSYAQPPLWAVFNNQYVAEEIIRTVVGSIALVCAVPLSSIIALLFLYPHPARLIRHWRIRREHAK
ncbi:MAG: hypothetical protein RIQ54_338 [Candidatus Parcubacteria bacterium]